MITLYVLDLEDEADAKFYQYLINLQINIISMNPQINNIDSESNVITANIQQETMAEPLAEIKVTIFFPDNLSPSVKQQKINRIYDILKPKSCYGGLIT